MVHDVYLCYDENDEEICGAISAVLEDNDVGTWIKSRDFSFSDSVDKITEAICDSKCFILIHSKSSKDMNNVVTEADIAFSNEIPIIIYDVDDSKIGRNIEFILQNKTKISAFPNAEKQLRTLVDETLKIVKKPRGNIKIDSQHVKSIEKVDPKRRENSIKKYVKIAIPIVVALVLIYLFVIMPTGQNTTSDGVFSMNVTDVGVDGNKYTVYGESYNLPADSVNYIMNIQFFDKNDDLVYEVNSTADEFKSGVIWSGDLHEGNATHIGFKLTDMSGNILSKGNYVI